ncbi:MAG: hypothetical protein NZM10_07440, partial [Fimbriimonadales bacterium]|nr:hypothetical protein [Fimbriimonadales bacterium]
MRSRDSGTYFPSRGPGYIIPDHITQLLAPYGWVYLNLLSSFVSALTVPVFAALLRAHQARYASLLLWLYALLPYHLIAYADVMIEYSLAVLHFLLGWWLLTRGRWAGSAIVWGIGAAMRPSQGVFVILMFLVAFTYFYGWRRGAAAALLSGGMLILLWLLPARWLTGSWALVTTYLPYDFPLGQWLRHIAIMFVAQLGIAPLLALGYLFWKSRTELGRRLRSDFGYLLAALIALSTLLLFLRHPFKTNYLLVGLPFVIYLLSAAPNMALVRVTVIAFLIHAIVAVPSSPPLGTNQIIGVGVLLTNWQNRHILHQSVEQLISQAPPKSVTVCAEGTLWFIEYEYLWKRSVPLEVHKKALYDPARDRWFLWTRDARSLKNWIERGYSVRITPTLYKMLQQSLQQAGLHDKIETLNIPRGI